MNEVFVFDTYALVELYGGNLNYEKYINKKVIVNDFIYAEYSYFLVKIGENDKDELLNELKHSVLRVNSKIINEAMKFRYVNRKKKMSMADCVSYVQARNMGVLFLTGDKEFVDLDGVEFVK